MRQASLILLLLAFVMQSFRQLIIVMDYYINPAEYEANCINKKKPLLKCHGKCQMVKKVNQEEQKDKDNPVRKFENSFSLYSASHNFYSFIIPLAFLHSNHSSLDCIGFPVQRNSDIFHPPAIV